MSRKPIGVRAMTVAERQARFRAKRQAELGTLERAASAGLGGIDEATIRAEIEAEIEAKYQERIRVFMRALEASLRDTLQIANFPH